MLAMRGVEFKVRQKGGPSRDAFEEPSNFLLEAQLTGNDIIFNSFSLPATSDSYKDLFLPKLQSDWPSCVN